MTKRLFDIAVAATLLIVLALPLAVLALLVRVKLGSPVLFRQQRAGLGGAPFHIMKFRTMRDDCGPDGQQLPDEVRLTEFGKWLRSTSFDELPELINILRGDMSLVGPRPLLLDYLPLYNVRQSRRHDVRPGLTGWAQINGRNAVEWDQRLEMDVHYVESRSLLLDMRILLLTAAKVLRREGISEPGKATMSRFTGAKTASAGSKRPAATAATAGWYHERNSVRGICMLNTLFSPWPCFTLEEADAVARVLLSNKVNYWTGSEARDFEVEFASWCGAKHAIALMNGTVALEVALKVLDIGAGAEVVVTPRTFVASASSVVTVGARPVFADVDRDSQNLTAATIEAVLTPATRAVVCVHLGGQPCDMDPIMALANDRGLAVIEDCAQANGALYKGRSVGTFGHINAWSFCQDKIMTTGGEGGMVTTDNTALWERAWSYKDHGKTWDAVYKRTHPLGVRLVHDNFGVNGRMTEMQAVLGRIQLKRMAEWHAARAQNAQAIRNVAARFPLMRVPPVPREMVHAWYRCYLFIEPEYLAEEWTRDRIIEEIVARGVPCLHGSASEVYLERSFKEAGLAPAMRLPVAHEFGETSIAFLVHPNLTVEEIEKTCDVLAEVAAMAQAVHVSAKASAAV